ncbi:MAG: hypothetical protein KGM44_03275 [bacterium]|nr:hypothetical protein [bacterium]
MSRAVAVRAGVLRAFFSSCLVLLTGCSPHLALTIAPNPVVLGRFDTHAVVKATVMGEGVGMLHISAAQVKVWGGARYIGHDLQIYSRTFPINQTVFVVPFVRLRRSYDVPINPWEVAIGNVRYATVEVFDGAGNVIGASRVGLTVDPRVAHEF